MELLITATGTIRTVYDEAIDLTQLGPLQIQRASQVEPDAAGAWWADLALVQGPRLGPFPLRSLALAAERAWLEQSLIMLPRPWPASGSPPSESSTQP